MTPQTPPLLLDERDLEPVGIGHRERPVSPRGLRRLAVEPPTLHLDVRRDRVDVLDRGDPEAASLAFLAVPPLREVVLAEHDVARARLHLYALQLATAFPPLPLREAEHVAVPGDAAGKVVDGEGRGQEAPAATRGCGAAGAAARSSS